MPIRCLNANEEMPEIADERVNASLLHGFRYEIANALVTKTGLSEKDIIAALRDLLELDLASYSLGMDEYTRAAQLAIMSGITIYDASYPVLAERLGVDFVTADRGLVNSLKGLEFVKAL